MIVGMFSPRDKHGQLLGKLNVWIGEEKGENIGLFRCCRRTFAALAEGRSLDFFFFRGFFT